MDRNTAAHKLLVTVEYITAELHLGMNHCQNFRRDWNHFQSRYRAQGFHSSVCLTITHITKQVGQRL
jgi:hypothetical protein